jgi:hypothetical protein
MSEENILNELKSIKKLLILIAMKSDANSDEIDKATGMGASNIRALFPKKKRTATKSKSDEVETKEVY